jgi:hypothetical protein
MVTYLWKVEPNYRCEDTGNHDKNNVIFPANRRKCRWCYGFSLSVLTVRIVGKSEWPGGAQDVSTADP